MPAMILFPGQENAYHKDDTLVSQVVFNLDMPVPVVGTNKATKPSSMPPAPKPASEILDIEVSKDSKLSPPSSPVNISNLSSENISNNSTPLGTSTITASTKDFNESDSQHKSQGCLSEDSDNDVFFKKEIKDDTEQDNDVPIKVETLAETSLPWRRQTNLPSVPSSVTSSLPDDENPLMSEAPSWADNLAYSHLTETGSPYCSPQNTITSKPAVSSHRPVFELFPPSSLQLNESAVSSIPPPWTCKDNSTSNQDDEPLPSYSVVGSNVGDKASCFLMSSHDRAPPSYHYCLQPTINGLDSRRHSDVGSPIHFQLMQKPEMVSPAAVESHLIGIEDDYYHGMADRVSQWLAKSSNSDTCLNDINSEIAAKEEAQRILESLHQKKWIMDESDDGTDADVESDNDILDTKL